MESLGKPAVPMMKWRSHMRVEPGNITLDNKGTWLVSEESVQICGFIKRISAGRSTQLVILVWRLTGTLEPSGDSEGKVVF